jgi:hypothetical protein
MVQCLLAGSPPLLARLEESYQVELVTFGAEIRRLVPTGSQSLAELLRALPAADETGQGASTRLGDAVDFALRGQAQIGPAEARPAALVLLSDGIGTHGQPLAAAATRARNLGVPLYTVAVGSAHPRAGLALDQPVAVESVFLGDALSVEVTVRAEGLAGRPARVVLRNTATGQVLEQTAVELPPAGKGKTVHLQVRPTAAGRLSMELQVELAGAAREVALDTSPIAEATNRSDSHSSQRPQHPDRSPKNDEFFEEVNQENNRRRLEVLVHEEPVRVLLVQSSPSYEFRALKAVLQRDPALRVRVWLQEADSRFAEVDATALRHFPLGQQELLPYDVVIWGDVNPEPLPGVFWPRLLGWVSEHGGGLALLAGPRFFPAACADNPQWGVLLPIRPAGGTGSAGTYSIRPTALGRRDPCLRLAGTQAAAPAFWRELPTFSWLWKTAQVKPGAQPLAEATSPDSNIRWPVIVRHFVGAGEVWMHLTDETWRLRYRRDDRAFARYWGQVVRRLARGKLVAAARGVRLLTDRSEYRLGAAVHVRAQFRNPAHAPTQGPLVLQCESSDQPRRPLELPRRWDLPGLFETTLQALPAGAYQLRWLPAMSQVESRAEPATKPMPAAVRFTVSAPPGELARLAVERQTLTEAAQETGGVACTLQTAGRLPEELPPAVPVTLEHLPSQRLASGHTVIGLLVGLLVAEWILRRRWGLV